MEQRTVFYKDTMVERMRPPSRLMESLFELCVVIGTDEDIGITANNRFRKGSTASSMSNGTLSGNEMKENHVLFSKPYNPKILAVLSGQIASFPHTEKTINGEPYYLQENVAFNTQGSLTPSKSHGKLRFAKPVELPFGTDVIFSLPQFCLPGGAWVYDNKPEDTIHTLVLTDIEGRRSYCTCLTFYHQYYATEDPFIPERFQLFTEEPPNLEGKCQICCVPMCCCLISRWPYFQIAKDCLSSFLPVLNQNGSQMRQSLMRLFSQLCLVPIPPPGPVNIEFELCGQKHFVRSSGEPKKRIIDMEFHLPFLCFSVDNILLLLSCILTQKRIVFLSSDYSLLTPIAEALLSYIQPLEWGLTYVPVLPSNLIDLLEAPGSFIMGCHSDHCLQVYQLLDAEDEGSGIVIADIDEGEVLVKKNAISLIPAPYQFEFKQRIKLCKFHFDLAVTSSISVSNINELKKRRQVFNQHCANIILEACLQLMLNLFSEFSHFIKKGGDNSQQVLFDRIAFVDSKPEQHREFFKQLCGSHAFSTYLCERYEEDVVDFFSAISETEQGTSVNQRKRSVFTVGSIRRKSSNLPNFQNLENEKVFVLTPFVNEGLHTGLFYGNCIKDLTTALQSSDSKGPSYKACCLYLRGMMFIANGQLYEALDDFFAIHSKSVQIFPTNSIVEILSQFDKTDLEKLKNKSYFRKIDLLLRKHKKVGGTIKSRKQLIFDGVPRYTVGKTEFVERVLLCQITESAQTAERLFRALVSGSGEKCIDPDTFSGLYAILNQADLEAQSVDIQGVPVEKHEFVIKVSSLCKTDLGVGRLVLTNIRLVFMADGGSKCEQVTRLLDIADIEKYQYYSVLPPGVPALRITKKEKCQKPFTACLKGERDVWCCYLKEMAVCHERAEALKDPQYISLGSQNVILTDALLKSGLPRSTAVMMCYFTNEDKPKEISGDTEKYLLQRLNPSEKDTVTTTVEALVYVPKDGKNEEQIWCGMGSGSIVIFKRGNSKEMWSFETQMSCANDRVSCLLVINKSHVWAGSFDATIYVIDRSCYKADQHLEEHSDYISVMIHEEERGIVWSASLNGQIIGWDTTKLVPVRRVKIAPAVRTLVSFVLVGKNFWCGIKSSLNIVDSEGDGEVKETLSIKDEKNNPLSVDCTQYLSENRILCGCGKTNKIALIDTNTLAYTVLTPESTEQGIGFSKMSLIANEVWVGNRNGHIYGLEIDQSKDVKNVRKVKLKRTLKIHDDSVRSMCVMEGGFVATGPGSRDGKIAIWRQDEETVEDFGFEPVSHDLIRAVTYKAKTLPGREKTKTNENNNKKSGGTF